MVMDYAPDISFLINLGIADPSVEFELERLWGTLLPIILAKSMPRELQKLAYKVMAIQKMVKSSDERSPRGDLPEFHFDELWQPRDIEAAIADPGSRRIFIKLNKNVQFFTETFIDKLCEIPPLPSSRRKVQRAPLAPFVPLPPISRTERYRIQRGLWRFQICCELSKFWTMGMFVAPEISSQVSPAHIHHPYLINLNYWELEEICCIYDHLEGLLDRDLATLHTGNTVINPLTMWNVQIESSEDGRYNNYAKSAKAKLLSQGLPFLQQYLEHFTLEQRLSIEDNMSAYEDGFILPALHEVINNSPPEWKAEKSSLSCSNGPWPDAPGGADYASTGWNYFLHDPTPTYTLDHMRKFGLCLWDAKRLKNWRRLIWQKLLHKWAREEGFSCRRKPDEEESDVDAIQKSCSQM